MVRVLPRDLKGRLHHGLMYRDNLLAGPRESQNAGCGLLNSEEVEWKHSLHASYLLRTPLSSEERTTFREFKTFT